MPELPEVETVARCLQRTVLNDRITKVRVLLERVVAEPDAPALACALPGRTFTGFRRRAKYLIAELVPAGWLLVHLRMSGRIRVVPAGEPPSKHTRLILELASGQAIRLDDLRTFGRVWFVSDPTPLLQHLGPEPLADDWTADDLIVALQHHHRALKPLLLDQTFVAGLGNIYVDEALFAAKLHPTTRSDRLTVDQSRRLHQAIRNVLSSAVAHGGTTLRDYRTPEGEHGEHQLSLMVYGREGEACTECGSLIVKTRVAQRGTHYCPVCQPPPSNGDHEAPPDER